MSTKTYSRRSDLRIRRPNCERCRSLARGFIGCLLALLTLLAAVLVLSMLMAGQAKAAEAAQATEAPDAPGSALGGWVLGVHVGTRHFPERAHLRDVNPGLYAISPGGWVAGACRNSLGRTSVYGGKVWSWGPASLTLGAISGYRRRPTIHEAVCSDSAYTYCDRWDTGVKTELTLLLAPSIALPSIAGVTPRISYLPSYGQLKSQALHLSAEHRF